MNQTVVPAPHPSPAHRADRFRKVAYVMVFEALTLAVAATVHLSGHVHGRGAPFDPDRAGIAEAVIGLALAAGAVVMLRVPERARGVGIVLNCFAAIGFLNGLTMTARGGHVPDIAYHLILLPVFIVTIVVLARTPPSHA